ncbi:hypothetical protein E6P09_02240 [Haloferax mediterranei ATCC 33500]|uniref:Uncharacterized protein n=1 Tax=Haloferax mediterranei (strain ATCC 33500 / DSM 1411 / JCM 8866 / NBRC 14739 / NCIMB 2177 / R-4) TaxID=523841 RepID=I3R5S6_HALMT|nr:hypothetical protein [Haloferax mediterranei]AFK19586.1 hypothetical protein HFX_1889 [Haloferax mediterranei ATCC 33500]AHZ22978.1 hypothetical protein BM92_10170 [Haloferax mediterranei ATCC 33500]ELZ99906.1 hypothetical protein C439_11243 [Haloferax mediterranei ATCC 33500]MDX5987673.1 hypothetical protein [Haloferax mediterranei ATCC 33500]QCQ74157.1 hypothetical protein E6P09_02240 [Haloferax mediterranei ATCC 33500]
MSEEQTPPRSRGPNADEQHVLTGMLSFWETVIEDAEATAAEYAEEGWETLVLHPGDVTVLPPSNLPDATDRVGFDVLVPGSEFEALSEWVADASFDRYDVYRAREGGTMFVVSVVQAAQAENAVVVPLYYGLDKVDVLKTRAKEQGALRLYVRPVEADQRVELVQSNPAPLFP